MRISNPFRYMLREAYPSVGTVYKAWFGKKYFIWKGKSLHQSVNSMAVELDQRLRLGIKPNDPYTKVCQHIRSGRVTIFEVEAISQSDNPADLLIAEYNELKVGENDPRCLNMTFFPHIPGWMPQTAKDEFQKYVQTMAELKKKLAEKAAKAKERRKTPPKKATGKSPANGSGSKLKMSPVKKSGNAKSKPA